MNFGWVETASLHAFQLDSRRWICDCGARGMWSVEGSGWKLGLLLDHFERAHKGRGTYVHGTKECGGANCPFHNPSQHSMLEFPKHIRYDRCMLVERICPHGVGHPDPDSLAWVNSYRAAKRWGRDDGTHGCDGCCRPGGWEAMNGPAA